MEIVINVLGWTGSAALLLGYGLNSYQKIKSDSLMFLLLNISGGVFLIIYTGYLHAYANTLLNIIWVIVAIPALFKVIRAKQTAR